jgi:transcriptional antiterminator RfaH
VAYYWAVARLEVQREAVGIGSLTRGGFEPYNPMILERRVGRRGIVKVEVPLFPSYVFLQIVERWHAARWSPGVIALLMSGDHPAKVADEVIEEIKARERLGIVRLPEAAPRFKPGDPVRVTAGPFIGIFGLVAGMRGPERVAVLLGSLRLNLPAADVQPAA